MMYDSLHEELLELDDSVEVYPAHGAGSLCGKNISKDRGPRSASSAVSTTRCSRCRASRSIELLTGEASRSAGRTLHSTQ